MSSRKRRPHRPFRRPIRLEPIPEPDIHFSTAWIEGEEFGRMSIKEMKGVTAGAKTDEEVHAFLGNLARNKKVHNFVCLSTRPGIAEWSQDLEYLHYPPGTPLNDNMQVILFKWKEMAWLVVTIPAKDHHLAVAAAKRTQMKVTDGVPLIIEGQGKGLEPKYTFFPLNSPNTYTIEYAEDSPYANKLIPMGGQIPDSGQNIFTIVSDPSRQ